MAKRSKGIDDRLKALDQLLRDGRARSEIELKVIRRQMDDLTHGHERGLVWDEEEAARACAFFPLLQHWKGPTAGQPFALEPWQEHCIIAPLLGWYRGRTRAEGGVRRFRQAYIEVPRKNGKTILASGIGNFGFIADRESGGEIYSAATMRDQAKILWHDAAKTLGRGLKPLVVSTREAHQFPALNAVFRPLSSDHNSLDGLNPHFALIDELHAHKDRGLYDVLESALGARSQPLLLAITTAGFNRSGICFQQRQIVLRMLAGTEMDHYFGFISTLDDGDDWTDPAIWRKANPNLGISINQETLADLCKTAQQEPQAENNFRCKRLNQWVEQELRWMPMELWAACEGTESPAQLVGSLRGRDCFIAIDLASTRDLASVGAVFPPSTNSEPWKCLVWSWCPSEGASRRDEQDRQSYKGWVGKWITATDGNSIDQLAIRGHLKWMRDQFKVRLVGADPWNMDEMFQQLIREGWPEEMLCKYGQSVSNYNEPMQRLLELVRDRKFAHGGNPVLDWAFGNLSVKTDHNGNIKPDKGKSQDKIDPACAVLMGLGLAIGEWKGVPEAPTFYETNELEIG